MDLLKYLEPMKNIPERFSNLAFWRGVRKLKDEILKTFEYVGEWGTSVEGEITNIEGDIITLNNTDHSLDSRISALENAGGGGSGSGSGALVFNSNSKSFNPTTIEVLKSNLDVSDAGNLLIPYPKVVYARLIGTLDNLEVNSLIVNALMSGSVAVSKGTQYSNTVQFTDEPMYAVRINDTSYKLYTGWIPFATKTKDGFKITMPNLTVNYTTTNMG